MHQFDCPACNKPYARVKNLKDHLFSAHNYPIYIDNQNELPQEPMRYEVEDQHELLQEPMLYDEDCDEAAAGNSVDGTVLEAGEGKSNCELYLNYMCKIKFTLRQFRVQAI